MDTFLAAKIILLIAAILFISCWLYVGMETDHIWWDGGPLAQRGYDPITDNIFKCAMLFFVVSVVFFNFAPPDWLIAVTIVVIAITLVLRNLFGWVS